MSTKLQRHKLSSLIDVKRGQSISGEYFASEGEHIRLTLANFDYVNGGFKVDTQKDDLFYTGPVKPECLLKKNDIITPLTEQALGLLGSTARIPESDKYVQSGDIALVTCKEGLIDPDFCYYLLPSKQVKKQLAAGSQQTKIRHTSPDAIKDCVVDIPDFEQQKKIGKFLSLLDRKISLNREINANLESLAKQIYDYWFVQFDFPDENGRPYKSSGGPMVWNDKLKREIPINWKAALVKDVISPIERGISYSSKDIASRNGRPMINLACYSKQGNYRVNEMKFFSGNIKVENKVYPYDLLIACTDMTQGADVIGRPILVTEEFEWYVYSMDLAKITPTEIGKMYLYYTLRTPFYHKYIKPFASGTTVKHLNTRGVEDYRIPIPSRNLQVKFEEILTAIKRQQMITINENVELTKQRDELMPLLMNGQVIID